jgi:hypothetical protein
MIQVSVTPRRLVAGRRSQLEIAFANTGSGACTDIVFKIGLPSGVALVSGKERVEIDAVRPGGTVVRALTVEPARPGEFKLTSPNFAYRDEDDEPVRIPDWSGSLSIEAEPAVRPRAPRPAPLLRAEHVGGELAVQAWDVLPILVRNPAGVPVSGISVSISGPIETNSREVSVPTLADGQAVKLSFNVKAADRGLVPVSVHMTYSYPDGLGSLRSWSREEQLTIQVTEPSGASRAAGMGGRGRDASHSGPASGIRTILYLTANPRDTELLRSDLEMRKVQEKLQLGRERDTYRLEYRGALRLDDVSQALLDYEPQVVHFSGHGDVTGGVYVENDAGRSTLINPDGLARMFGQHADTIRCVVVNACHSAALAEAIARRIDYAVGMRSTIGDKAAVQFSIGFYQALFAGRSVPDAFERGCVMVEANSATGGDYQTPVLYSRRAASEQG